MSLFDILGVQDTDYAAVGDFLRRCYIENSDETARMAHARELDEFYEGRGDEEMKDIIDKVYTSEKNRTRRKAFIDAGLEKYDNIIWRIVREKATVYSEPPRRSIAVGDFTYQQFLEVLQLDDSMRELDRKLALHEDALAWYRVRKTPTGLLEPLLEIVSPASFWALAHPKDRTLLIGIIFDQRMPLSMGYRPEHESFRVWTHDQTFVMNGKSEIFPTSIESWPLGVMPGVLASMRRPGAKPYLLAPKPSADLLSAQKAIRLQSINLAKESVSAVRQTYITGDTSATVMGQTSDTEGEVFLGEGVSASALDRGMDQEEFRDNGGFIGDAVASNHGLAPSVLRQRDASSGAEIELRRIPIREQRKERIPVMRRVERHLAHVMSLVNSERVTTTADGAVIVGDDGQPVTTMGDLPTFAFSDDGWSIDFGEVQQPMSEAERDQVYENRKRLHLTDPYEEEMRRNPDLKTVDEAKAIIDERIRRNTDFVIAQKDLMAASGALGAVQPKTPFESNQGTDEEDDGPGHGESSSGKTPSEPE